MKLWGYWDEWNFALSFSRDHATSCLRTFAQDVLSAQTFKSRSNVSHLFNHTPLFWSRPFIPVLVPFIFPLVQLVQFAVISLCGLISNCPLKPKLSEARIFFPCTIYLKSPCLFESQYVLSCLQVHNSTRLCVLKFLPVVSTDAACYSRTSVTLLLPFPPPQPHTGVNENLLLILVITLLHFAKRMGIKDTQRNLW